MADLSVSPKTIVADMNRTQHTLDSHRLTPVGEGANETWGGRIDRINREIEEKKLQLATQSFRDYQPILYNLQFSQLFNALMEAARDQLAGIEQFEEQWCANLVDQLGEALALELTKELNGQGTREKIVQAMAQLARLLDLEEPPGEHDLRRMLASKKDGRHMTISPETPVPPLSEPSLPPTPPSTLERAGPSGLKRPKESFEAPSRPRSSGDKDVSTAGLPFVPSLLRVPWPNCSHLRRDSRPANRPQR